ncbi:hypothetical protein [Flavobacterium caeni]|nr:hypothetical protein [Flavobacterium caeni]
MRKLLLLLAFVLFVTGASAQESRMSSGIPEVKAFIASLKATEQTSRAAASTDFSQASSVEDLVFKAHDAQYLSGGVVKTYGSKPRQLFIDATSMGGLNNPSLLKNNVDIVTIRINSASDLNATIDLSQFSSFKSLKYVHIVSTVATSASHLSSKIVNNEERLTVFYSIHTGEGNQ